MTRFASAICASTTAAHPLVIAFSTGRKEGVGEEEAVLFIGAYLVLFVCRPAAWEVVFALVKDGV